MLREKELVGEEQGLLITMPMRNFIVIFYQSLILYGGPFPSKIGTYHPMSCDKMVQKV